VGVGELIFRERTNLPSRSTSFSFPIKNVCIFPAYDWGQLPNSRSLVKRA
jgi:hypothetical protein